MNDYVKMFMEKYSNIYGSMLVTSHNYSAEYKSLHHLEGCVWTHTMMVLNQAQSNNFNENIQIAALLHDIGKPMSVSYDHEKKKKHFIGHEGISAYLAIDYLNETTLSEKDKIEIFKLVALHGHFYKLMSSFRFEEKLINQFKYDSAFFEKLLELNYADTQGRLTEKPKITLGNHFSRYKDVYMSLDYVNKTLDPSKKDLTILVGPPCSGKSTFSKDIMVDSCIISRDELIMTEGTFDYEMDYIKRYNYFYSLDGFKGIDLKLSRQIGAASRDKIPSIVVDMTNMSTKARRRTIGQFNRQAYNIHIKLFATGYKELLDRNSKRAGKVIPEDIIVNMMKQFNYPLMDEYDTLEVIWKDK